LIAEGHPNQLVPPQTDSFKSQTIFPVHSGLLHLNFKIKEEFAYKLGL